MSIPLKLSIGFSTALLAFSASPAVSNTVTGQAGVAAAVRGNVTLIASTPRLAGRTVGQNLDSGDQIFLGDVIETGSESGMQIMLLDETIFTIGPDAGLVIDEFVYTPGTSAGQVTATVLKGAFRFVSGRVAKAEPRNMNVKTPVGTIGIRGTSAAGRINPPDANGVITAQFVLLGPGVDNNASERAGRIIVTNGGTSVEISRSGFGTTINGLNGIPSPPGRIDPVQVGALTAGLGTNGAARPERNSGPDRQNGASAQPGPTNRLAPAASLSGQNLGQAGIGATDLGRVGGRLDQTNRQLLAAAEETASIVNTTIATFDQLRSVQTGTASFNFGTIALNHVSGPNTNSGGSYQASATIDFGARTLDLTVSSVSYFFNGGPNQLFVFNPNAGQDINGGYDNDSGFVADTWTTSAEPDRFPTLPTDGSSAEVSAAILNDLEAGTIASRGRVSVRIDNGTDVISGGKTVAAQ